MPVVDVSLPANRIQTVTLGGTGLTSFRLTYAGQQTASLAAAATASQVQAALEALSTIGAGNVAVTGSGPFTVTLGTAITQQSYSPPRLTATPTGGSGTVTITIPAPAVVDVPVSGVSRGTLDLYMASAGSAWVTTDGSTPTENGLNCHMWWYDPEDPDAVNHLYLDNPSGGVLKVLPVGGDVRLRIADVPHYIDVRKLNRGFGMSAQPEYAPLSSAGVSSYVLSGSYGPGQWVRVDFPSTSADYAVTSDGSVPSLASPANTILGGRSHMISLAYGNNPGSSLRVYASAGLSNTYMRISKISSSAQPHRGA